jgi:myo-inositol-1(or 4)-monophosphatase
MDFFAACDRIAEEVNIEIAPFIGVPEGGEIVKMGADNTPTKKIDQVAEDVVIRHIQENALCRLLISEEAGKVTFPAGNGTIFLDPLDGTFNAVAGIPFYALSVAYAQEGIVTKAFVRNLATGETFTAEKGKFSSCNKKPLRVSRVSSLDKCAVSVYGRKFDPTCVMLLGQKIRRWRLLGASALELCYVGAGRLDAFIDLRGTLRVTDAAAGMLVCSEAGGTVTDLNGGILDFPEDVTVGRSLIATNGVIHHKVVEYLR